MFFTNNLADSQIELGRFGSDGPNVPIPRLKAYDELF